MFTFYIENHEPLGALIKNCAKLDKNKSIVSRFSVFVVYKSAVSTVQKSNYVQSVSWSLAEFRHNKIVQSPHENYFNVCRQHKEK